MTDSHDQQEDQETQLEKDLEILKNAKGLSMMILDKYSQDVFEIKRFEHFYPYFTANDLIEIVKRAYDQGEKNEGERKTPIFCFRHEGQKNIYCETCKTSYANDKVHKSKQAMSKHLRTTIETIRNNVRQEISRCERGCGQMANFKIGVGNAMQIICGEGYSDHIILCQCCDKEKRAYENVLKMLGE